MTINSKSIITTTGFSEIGPADGLVAWYPLQGDTKDYANSNDGTNNGAIATARGYSFTLANNITSSFTESDYVTKEITLSCWLKITESNSSPNFLDITDNFRFEAYGLGIVVWLPATAGWSNASFGNSTLNQWHMLTATYDSSEITRTYRDSALVSQTSHPGRIIDTNPSSVGIGNIVGSIADARIYNRALSAEEISILYEITNPEINSRMKQSKDCVYIRGEFQEA